MVDSRFWPDVCKLHANGSIGQPYPVKPLKIDESLANDPTLRWLAEDFHLAKCLLVSPPDFYQKRLGLRGIKRRAISEPNHIDNIYWQQLFGNNQLPNIGSFFLLVSVDAAFNDNEPP
jgi:hypothetical protein